MAFKNLPRLTFGNLQAKLFPIYFKVLTGSAVVVLVVYAAKHAADGLLATKSGANLQLAALAGTLVFTLMNLLVLGAPCLVLVLNITCSASALTKQPQHTLPCACLRPLSCVSTRGCARQVNVFRQR